MKNKRLLLVIITGSIIVLAGLVVGLLLFINNQPAPVRGIEPLAVIEAMEPDSEKWGLNFPNQYSTFLKTQSNNIRTSFGGSEKVDKLAVDPMLKVLFAGYSFSKGYDEDRGHLLSLEDVRNTPRINESTSGTCYSCKSSNNPQLWAEMGMAAYDATKFSTLGAKITYPIGCANCHEANTMRLIVTNPALDEALKSQGKDWKMFTRQEMRSVVCANCHVEYYFKGDDKYLTFPWVEGNTIEAIEKYYDGIKFADWEHPDSGAKMIKMQHPDYELFSAGSTHYKAGVACADCHMPYLRDGTAKFSSHDVKSPLLTPAESCGSCHTDVEYVTGRVSVIQQQVNTTMLNTEKAIVDAIEAIKETASLSGADPDLLEEARRFHRAAQMRWDFIAAENSMGFHNPEEALRILASATDLARQAEINAIRARSSSIASGQ